MGSVSIVGYEILYEFVKDGTVLSIIDLNEDTLLKLTESIRAVVQIYLYALCSYFFEKLTI